MKKLIFIDNDDLKHAKEDVDDVKNRLELDGHLNEDYVETIEIVSDLHRLSKDQLYELMFNTNNCICSWSMFTATHYGSLFQMTQLLTAAGINDIKGMIHIDCSGMLLKALEQVFLSSNTKHPFPILQAIETNYIIIYDKEEDKLVRLRTELKGIFESPFKTEDIDLNILLR